MIDVFVTTNPISELSSCRKVASDTRKALKPVPRPPTNTPLSVSEAQEYVGDWGVPKAQIFLDGKILKVKPPGYPGDGLKLLYQGEHTLAIEGIQSDMRLKFVFDGAQANWFLFITTATSRRGASA